MARGLEAAEVERARDWECGETLKEMPLKEEDFKEVERVVGVAEKVKGEKRESVGWEGAEARMLCAIMAANAACIQNVIFRESCLPPMRNAVLPSVLQMDYVM